MKVQGLNYTNQPAPDTADTKYRVLHIIGKMARREKRERDAEWKQKNQ